MDRLMRVAATAGLLFLTGSALAASSGRSAQLEDFEGWFSDDMYPQAEANAGHGGRVKFLLEITASGAPVRCDVLASSGWPVLDQQTCMIMLLRGRAKVAHDEAFVSIAGVIRMSFLWSPPNHETPKASLWDWADFVLPVEKLPKGNEAQVKVRRVVEADGSMVSCATEESSSILAIDRSACAVIADVAPHLVVGDGGKAVRTSEAFNIAFVAGSVPQAPVTVRGQSYVLRNGRVFQVSIKQQ